MGEIMKIKELLIREKDNNKTALIFEKDEISYAQWYNMSSMKTELYKNIFDGKYDSVAIFLPNSIYYAIAYFSISFCDKTIVPIDIKSKSRELILNLDYCDIKVLLTNDKYFDLAINYLKNYKKKIAIVSIESDKVIVLNNEDESEYERNLELEDVAIMLHTSGTTSNPKRVMLTHKNLISNIESNIKSLNLTENDITCIALPMYFGYCNTAQFLTHTYMGATMYILDKIFLPKKFFSIVEKYKITNFTAVPTMLIMMLDYRYAEKYNLDSLRYICFGGGNMPINKLKILMEKYKSVGFVQTYGQTECSPRITALLPKYAKKKIGSVGKCIPDVRIKIVDDNNKEIKDNSIGEIIVNGENIMKGYFKCQDVTNNTIIDGWLHTGDIGYLDKDGFLYLKGRKKNIIISGGINIYPEEIEEILMSYDKISEVLVYGEENEILGEEVRANIVVNDNINLCDLKEFCKTKLSDYKIPKEIYIVESLDKTYNNKIKRI